MSEDLNKTAFLMERNTNQLVDNLKDDEFLGLLERAGTKRRYQVIVGVLLCVVSYLTGGLMLMTPFLTYQDPYIQATCLDHVCALSFLKRYEYLPQEQTMESLSNHLGDYRCADEAKEITLMITLMYVGNVVGYACMTLVGDLMGRKRLMLANLFICLLGLILTCLSSSILMAGISLLLMAFGVFNSFNLCFAFIAEIVTQKWRDKLSVGIQVFFGLGALLNVLWYYIIANWQIIIISFYIVPLVLLLSSFIVFVRDTPICLVTRYSSQEALDGFAFIAKINNKEQTFQMNTEQLQKVNEEYQAKINDEHAKEENKTFSILDLFREQKLRWKTIVLIIINCVNIFQFFAPSLLLARFDLSIYINGLSMGLSQMVAYLLCYFIINKVKRKHVAVICFSLTFLCAMALLFLWDQGHSEETPELSSSIAVLILVFFFSFAITAQYTYFYVYYNELYPTQVRVLGTALVSAVGSIMLTIAPFILQICIAAGFPIMVLFASFSALSVVLSTCLPQTLKVNNTMPADLEATQEQVVVVEQPQNQGQQEVDETPDRIAKTDRYSRD